MMSRMVSHFTTSRRRGNRGGDRSGGWDDGDERDTGDVDDGAGVVGWYDVNERLHGVLDALKTSIGHDRRWERAKRFFNPYELVSSSLPDMPNMTSHVPTSRAFFKLIELLHDFDTSLTRPYPMHVAFLADGPGGFIEAFIAHRKMHAPPRGEGDWIGKDVLHGITLVESSSSGAPGWRLPRDMVRNNNVHLQGQVDTDGNDGDLYNLTNIDCFVKRVGQCTCDLVTADGGFDFSRDFNSQERSSHRLLVSEIYTALVLQAPGGALVVKVYDLRLPETLRMLWHLQCCYAGGIAIVKPVTSRAANSEKYVVCSGFVRTERTDMLVTELRESVRAGDGEVPPTSCDVDDDYGDGDWDRENECSHLPPTWFMQRLTMYNARYIEKQARTIISTLAHMQSMQHGDTQQFPNAEEQVQAAQSWFVRYGIPLSHHWVSVTGSRPFATEKGANVCTGSQDVHGIDVGTDETHNASKPIVGLPMRTLPDM